MSAIGTKRTCELHCTSAFGGKADMPFALQMSASDQKRTSICKASAKKIWRSTLCRIDTIGGGQPRLLD